jgi:hypothetical protein
MYPVAAGSLYAEAGMEMTIPRQIHHEDGMGIAITRRVMTITRPKSIGGKGIVSAASAC